MREIEMAAEIRGRQDLWREGPFYDRLERDMFCWRRGMYAVEMHMPEMTEEAVEGTSRCL